MRKLPREKRVAILTALIEGMGVNSTARLFGVSKVTVLRLLVDAGDHCRLYHDRHVRELRTRCLQLDEVWAFVGCKKKTKLHGGQGHGDSWLWVALDADTRLVVAYHVGDHADESARSFLTDVVHRLAFRVQITTDTWKSYIPMVREVFGPDRVDYGVLAKHYLNNADGERTAAARYTPSIVVNVSREAVFGAPDAKAISTSYVERSHLELRTHNRRFVRLGMGFSKRLGNHEAAIALHFFARNFIRKHSTLRTTPAVAAGVASKAFTVADLVDLIETRERLTGGRLTEYLPAAG